MKAQVYRFEFGTNASVKEAEMTLQVAIYAAEGLLGESQIHLDFTYFIDEPRNTIYIDGTTLVGNVIAHLFMGLILREFGETAFRVGRVGTPASRGVMANFA